MFVCYIRSYINDISIKKKLCVGSHVLFASSVVRENELLACIEERLQIKEENFRLQEMGH